MHKVLSVIKQKRLWFILGVVVVLWVFGKQLGKLLTFLRSRLQGSVITSSVQKKVAADSGTTVKTVAAQVRQEFCKGVASAVFAAMHEKPLGFLPRGIFGSTEDEKEIKKELNSLENGLEAKFVSSYYAEKYGQRLKGLVIKYVGYTDIRAEIWNNIT